MALRIVKRSKKEDSMEAFTADRRLYLSSDKSRVVEEGDPSAAWLFATCGGTIREADAEAYGLSLEGGKVVLRERKARAKIEDKAVEKAEDKSAGEREVAAAEDGETAATSEEKGTRKRGYYRRRDSE